jgi:antitoxin component YwqK of YwqJK toxin-antitoxin module
MKTNLFLIFAVLFLFSCSKKDSSSSTSQKPLVKTISFDSTVVQSFWYDNQGRITCYRTIESPGIDSTVYFYNSNTLERRLYYNGILSETEHGTLENGNLVFMKGIKADSSSFWSTYYTYDGDGFLIREIHMDNDTVETWRAEYQVADGNVVSMNRSNYIPVVCTYAYYPGTTNSLGSMKNVTFMGKNSKNLIKKSTWNYSAGSTGEEDETYEYYENGWVKKVTSINGSQTIHAYFTYW